MLRVFQNVCLSIANAVENARDKLGQIGSGDSDVDQRNRMMVAQFHEQDGHPEPSWTDCHECMENFKQLNEIRASAARVAEKVILDELGRFHEQNGHQGPSGTDCPPCLEYLKQLKSARDEARRRESDA